jgi:hypothetical protein
VVSFKLRLAYSRGESLRFSLDGRLRGIQSICAAENNLLHSKLKLKIFTDIKGAIKQFPEKRLVCTCSVDVISIGWDLIIRSLQRLYKISIALSIQHARLSEIRPILQAL